MYWLFYMYLVHDVHEEPNLLVRTDNSGGDRGVAFFFFFMEMALQATCNPPTHPTPPHLSTCLDIHSKDANMILRGMYTTKHEKVCYIAMSNLDRLVNSLRLTMQGGWTQSQWSRQQPHSWSCEIPQPVHCTLQFLSDTQMCCMHREIKRMSEMMKVKCKQTEPETPSHTDHKQVVQT